MKDLLTNGRLLVLGGPIILLLCGCAYTSKPLATDIISPIESPEAYIAFLSENKRLINQIYADDYADYPNRHQL